MYLSIGKNSIVSDGEIIGLFDLDICSQSYLTREFLSAAEKDGAVVNAAEDIPNSFLITQDRKVWLLQSMSRTMAKKIIQSY